MMTSAQQPSYETVIGLEVHLQFDTKTKIFCGCANTFGAPPNTNVCPVCMGLPGSLPVVNQAALTDALKVALALHCRFNPRIKFDRKNYYYPDLPKGYQISQYDWPIGHDGIVDVPTDDGERKVRIHRAHLEEDAGKLIHDAEQNASLVDYNRAGTPLMEIVTEPDIRSPEEAYQYLQALKLLLQYLDVSDCDMEKGSLRCDANISLRPQGASELGVKAELKNMNSFKAVRQALAYEQERQRDLLERGEKVIQETRLWDETKALTSPMRTKEEAHDYRYFPEPDLAPFVVAEKDLDAIRTTLPEFPEDKFRRFRDDLKLSSYEARIMIQDRAIADFFESCRQHYPTSSKISNWIIGPLLQELNARKTSLNMVELTPFDFTQLIKKVEEGVLSQLAGKDVLKIMLDTRQSPESIIKERGLSQISDESSLETVIGEIFGENPKVVQQIREGKESALGFLVGQVMKKTRGKANPKKVNELIRRRFSDG